MEIIGIGCLNLDFIYDVEDLDALKVAGLDIRRGSEIVGNGGALSALTEELARHGIMRKASAGGSASNTCHMLSLMGYPTRLVGVLGTDAEADLYLRGLFREDTVMVARKGHTGTAYIINDRKKDRSIVIFPNSNSALTEADIDLEAIGMAQWVHMTSYVTEEALKVQESIKSRYSGKTRFSLDPGELYAGKGVALYPLLEGMEILFIGVKELELLFRSGEDEALKKALELVQMVVLKRGRQGASLFTGEYTCHAGAEGVDVVDNTGAGDVLNGVFLGLHLRGADLEAALRTATWAASVSTRGYGRGGYPSRQEVDAFYEKGACP
jgi:sugar/nucleoside kinase (ribokinase family)